MLINIPIENLEERYSAQWNKWIPEAFRSLDVPFITIYPEHSYAKIEQGEFLDVIGTHVFKFAQLQEVIPILTRNADAVVFFHDLWFPGIEALFYIRDALGLSFKITGCLHAGTWDDNDFLSRKGMGRWARGIEASWLQQIDLIFVATHYHQSLIRSKFSTTTDNILVTGFPFFRPPWPRCTMREDIVVFPHRLAPEKDPEFFDLLAALLQKEMPTYRFIKTKEVCSSKSAYYQLLGKSKIAVSAAWQETWGIAQQEATVMGCLPVVPDRLSYKEMYPTTCRYSSFEEAAEKVHMFSTKAAWSVDNLISKFLENGTRAVPNMVRAIRDRGWLE